MIRQFSYTFSVLRYRHDPLADEQVNVGLVFHSPAARFSDFKARHTHGRFSLLYPDLDRDAFRLKLRAIERGVSRIAEEEGDNLFARLSDATALGRRALPQDDSSFIWGEQGSGITTDPEGEFERLFERFVTLYDKEKRPVRQDADVWRPVRELLVSRGIAHRLQKKVIASPVDKVEFDHAWKNGAWNVVEALSFDLATEDTIKDKARRWVGQLTTVSKTEEKFTPHFIVGKPSSDALLPAYDAALGILRASPVAADIVEEANVASLVDQIERDIRQHE
jgi:hypothetical protein